MDDNSTQIADTSSDEASQLDNQDTGSVRHFRDYFFGNSLERLTSELQTTSDGDRITAILEAFLRLEKSAEFIDNRDAKRVENCRVAVRSLLHDTVEGARVTEVNQFEKSRLIALALRAFASLSQLLLAGNIKLLGTNGWFDSSCATVLLTNNNCNSTEISFAQFKFFEKVICETLALENFNHYFPANDIKSRQTQEHLHGKLVVIVFNVLQQHRFLDFVLNTLEAGHGDLRLQAKAIEVFRSGLEIADSSFVEFSQDLLTLEDAERILEYVDSLTDFRIESLAVAEVAELSTACFRLLSELVIIRPEICDSIAESSDDSKKSIPERLVDALDWLMQADVALVAGTHDECAVAILDCVSELSSNRNIHATLISSRLCSLLVAMLPSHVMSAREALTPLAKTESQDSRDAFNRANVLTLSSTLRCLRLLVSYSERDKNAAIAIRNNITDCLIEWFDFLHTRARTQPEFVLNDNFLELVAFFGCFLEVPSVRQVCELNFVHVKLVGILSKFCFSVELTQSVLDYFLVHRYDCENASEMSMDEFVDFIKCLTEVARVNQCNNTNEHNAKIVCQQCNNANEHNAKIVCQVMTILQFSAKSLVRAIEQNRVTLDAILQLVENSLFCFRFGQTNIRIVPHKNFEKMHLETCQFLALLLIETSSIDDQLLKSQLATKVLDRNLCVGLFHVLSQYQIVNNDVNCITAQTITYAFKNIVKHGWGLANNLFYDACEHCHLEIIVALLKGVNLTPTSRTYSRSRRDFLKSVFFSNPIALCTIERKTTYSGSTIDEGLAYQAAELVLKYLRKSIDEEQLRQITAICIKKGEHAIAGLLISSCHSFNSRCVLLHNMEFKELRVEWFCRIVFGKNSVYFTNTDFSKSENPTTPSSSLKLIGMLASANEQNNLPDAVFEDDYEKSGIYRHADGTLLPFDSRDFRSKAQQGKVATLPLPSRRQPSLKSSMKHRRLPPVTPIQTIARDRRTGNSWRATVQNRNNRDIRKVKLVDNPRYVIVYENRSTNKNTIKIIDLEGNQLEDFRNLDEYASIDPFLLLQLLGDLEELNCASNRFERLPPILFQLPAQIGGINDLRVCRSLKRIDFSNNLISEFPFEMTNSGVLEKLNLAKNQLTDASLTPNDSAGISDSLVDLVLDENRLTSYPALFLHRHTPNIQSLSLAGNAIANFSSVLDANQPFRLGMAYLAKLSLANNKLKQFPTELFSELPRLEELDLSDNDFSSAIAFPSTASLSEVVPRLHTLTCRNCRLQEVPSFVLSLRKLKVLDLSCNQLAEFPPIGSFQTDCMRDLDLQRNSIASLSLKRAYQWKLLRRLILAENRLTQLPTEIGLFDELVALDLSQNPLISLPVELCCLKKLSSLLLANVQPRNVPPDLLKVGKVEELQAFLEKQYKASNYYYGMKLFVVGTKQSGKSTFLDKLTKRSSDKLSATLSFSANSRRNRSDQVVEWKVDLRVPSGESVPYTFSCWDFPGFDVEFYSNFFDQRAVYFVLFSLTKGVSEIYNVAKILRHVHQATLRMPPLLFLIGTHADLPEPDMSKITIKTISTRLDSAIPKKLKVHGISWINTLSADPSRVRKTLLEAVARYSYRGEMRYCLVVPSSYLKLKESVMRLRMMLSSNDESICILRKRDLVSKLHQQGFPHTELLSNGFQFQEAIKFLRNIGVLLHFDDTVGRLNELVFLDPTQLVRLMAKLSKALMKSQQQGLIDRFTLHEILELTGLPYKEMLASFERLSVKFGLLIQHSAEKNKFLVFPSLLPTAPSQLREYIDASGATAINQRRYYFEFLPSKFAKRAIARLQIALNSTAEQLNKQMSSTIWKKGMAFIENARNFVRVEITACEPGEIDRVDIMASCNQLSAPLFAKAVSCLDNLIDEHFDFLRDSDPILEPLQNQSPEKPGSVLAACYRCPSNHAFWFPLQQLAQAALNAEKTRCARCHKSVDLKLIAPDLYFADVRVKSSNCEHLTLKQDDKLLHGSGLLVDLAGNPLGSGGFGVVFAGKLRNQNVAIKQFSTGSKQIEESHQIFSFSGAHINNPSSDRAVKVSKQQESESAYRDLRRELTVFHNCGSHPSLVELLGFSLSPKLIVLEYAQFGSLGSFFKSRKMKLIASYTMMTRIAIQIADGLRFLHSHNIVHRDLKPDNVLIMSVKLKDAINAKLTDFGIAQECAELESLNLPFGTPGYRAPEVIQAQAYSSAADVYSFGVLLHALLNAGHIPADDAAVNDIEVDKITLLNAERRSTDGTLQSLTVSTAGKTMTRLDFLEYIYRARASQRSASASSLPFLDQDGDFNSTSELVSWPAMSAISARCLRPVACERPSASQLFNAFRRVEFASLRHAIPIHLQSALDCVTVRVANDEELVICVSTSFEEFGTHISWIRFNHRTNQTHVQANVLNALLNQPRQAADGPQEHVLCMSICGLPKVMYMLIGCGDGWRQGRLIVFDEVRRTVAGNCHVSHGQVVCVKALRASSLSGTMVLAGLDTGYLCYLPLTSLLRNNDSYQRVKVCEDEPVMTVEELGRFIIVASGNTLSLFSWNKQQLIGENPVVAYDTLVSSVFADCAADVHIKQIVVSAHDSSTYVLVAYRARRHTQLSLKRACTLDVLLFDQLGNNFQFVTSVNTHVLYTSISPSDYSDDGQVEKSEKVSRPLRITTVYCDTAHTGSLLIGTAGGYLYVLDFGAVLTKNIDSPLIIKRYNGPIQNISHVWITADRSFGCCEKHVFATSDSDESTHSSCVEAGNGNFKGEEEAAQVSLQSCFVVAGEMFMVPYAGSNFLDYNSLKFGSSQQQEDEYADGSGCVTVWADNLLQQRDAMSKHLAQRNRLLKRDA